MLMREKLFTSSVIFECVVFRSDSFNLKFIQKLNASLRDSTESGDSCVRMRVHIDGLRPRHKVKHHSGRRQRSEQTKKLVAKWQRSETE